MWFTRIQYYYSKGYYTNTNVATFANAGYITYSQYYEITDDKTQLSAWIVDGKVTAEEYAVITGETYEPSV
jgi:uncharacterized XkdX family phage protein